MAPTDLLGQLDTPTRTALLAGARRRALKRGEYVFRVGDEGDSVFLLLHGRAKSFKLSPGGREVILWFCFPGELFGLAAHPRHKGRMITVQACEPSEVAELSSAAFAEFMAVYPHVSALCIQAMAFRLGMLANRLVRLTVDDAPARVAKLLIDLAARYGDDRDAESMPLAITHQEIADMTGVQRQTVTSILGEFSAQGALSASYRRIVVTNRELLATYAARPPG
jgi:CRP/FNR family transcriptional regulator, cyclic AMP receptor protein